jgi:negative regulator of sigma E activity
MHQLRGQLQEIIRRVKEVRNLKTKKEFFLIQEKLS